MNIDTAVIFILSHINQPAAQNIFYNFSLRRVPKTTVQQFFSLFSQI